MYEDTDLDLPDAAEYTAKCTLMSLLQTSPTLNAVVRTWLFYEGEDVSDSDPDSIPRPFVRMTVKPGPSMWFTEGSFRFDMQAAIELAVDGLRDRNILNLWNAVRTAWSPHTPAPDGSERNVFNIMQGGGISQINFAECPYAIVNAGTGKVRYLYARGEFTATLFVNV